jgi:hypothetical protein
MRRVGEVHVLETDHTCSLKNGTNKKAILNHFSLPPTRPPCSAPSSRPHFVIVNLLVMPKAEADYHAIRRITYLKLCD